MALGIGSLVNIVMVQTYYNQQVINSFDYLLSGSWPTVSAENIAEAWWNHVKTTYRAIPANGYGDVFQTVLIRELDNAAGEYAEFSVPLGERGATRSVSGGFEGMPPFCAVGVRLTVGTRATRPGQKRFAGAHEFDQSVGRWTSSILTPVNAHAAVLTTDMALGAPAATLALRPIVRRTTSSGATIAHQPIIGFLTNVNVTTQNSRKFGRGA